MDGEYMIELVKMNLYFDSKSFEIKSQNSSVFHEIMDMFPSTRKIILNWHGLYKSYYKNENKSWAFFDLKSCRVDSEIVDFKSPSNYMMTKLKYNFCCQVGIYKLKYINILK